MYEVTNDVGADLFILIEVVAVNPDVSDGARGPSTTPASVGHGT